MKISEYAAKLDFPLKDMLDLFKASGAKKKSNSNVTEEEIQRFEDFIRTDSSPRNTSNLPHVREVFSAYRDINFEALKKERAKVTRQLNNFCISPYSEARRIALDIREDELEAEGIAVEREKGTSFKTCTKCGLSP